MKITDGRKARITCNHSSSSYGIPVLVVEGEVLGSAEVGDIEIERATPRELRELSRGGYWSLVIYYLRRERGWTQHQMGDALGVDPISVSRWERGEVSPDALAREGALARLLASKNNSEKDVDKTGNYR